MKQSVFDDSVKYYTEHYDEIFLSSFEGHDKVFLRDHDDHTPRICRFCGKGSPDTTFKNTAHAVPEFLGNRIIISLNECDSCNASLATNYEDHLSKWSLSARALSQIRGKRGMPKFKNPGGSLVVKSGQSGPDLEITDPAFFKELSEASESSEFRIPVDATSQKYAPVNAAKAIVKVACSICPTSDLEECRPAIDWLMQRTDDRLSRFPVLYMFTPGPVKSTASNVRLLRRKSETEIPYLWCIIQYGPHRLQTFVPFCPADRGWLNPNRRTNLKMKHFPSQFGPQWEHGDSELSCLDWAGEERKSSNANASVHIREWIRISPPNESGDTT